MTQVWMSAPISGPPIQAGAVSRPGRLRLALAGVDPGLSRLRDALTAVLSIATAALVVQAVRHVGGGGPVTAVLYAGVLAMFAVIAVREHDLGRRRVTTAMLVLTACPATVVGALLAPHRVAAQVVFVAAAAAAVWVRRWGPRADALGLAGMVPFFSTQFFGAVPGELAWLLAGAAIGVATTLLVRGWVLVERPGPTTRHLLGAVRARAWAVTRALEQECDDAVVRRAWRRFESVSEQVQNQLDRLGPGSHTTVGESDDDLAEGLLYLEWSLERLVLAKHAERRSPTAMIAVRDLSHALAAQRPPVAQAWARSAHDRVAGAMAADHPGLAEAVTAVASALESLGDLEAERDARGSAAPAAYRPDDGSVPSASVDGASHGRSALHLRQAAQVAVAATLAIGVSEAVAPTRWVWAVITCFVVFNGTTTRGDVGARGGWRVVGTAGGALCGVAVAALVGDHHGAAIALLAVAVFLALYLAEVSPALLAFFITTALALLYGLLGRFSTGLIALRVEETLIGSIAGVLAAVAVFPADDRDELARVVARLIGSTTRMLRAAAARAVGDVEPDDPPSPLVVRADIVAVRERAARLVRGRGTRRAGDARAALAVRIAAHEALGVHDRARQVLEPGWTESLDPLIDAVADALSALGERFDATPRQVDVHTDQLDRAAAYVEASGSPEHRDDAQRILAGLRRLDQVACEATRGAARRPGQS